MASPGFQWRILEEPRFLNKSEKSYCLLRIWVGADGKMANGMRPSCIASDTEDGLAVEAAALQRAFMLPHVHVVDGRYEEMEVTAQPARPRRKIAR